MANNQYVNKVSYVENGTPRVLIDISSDTVTPSTLLQGYTAHDASGAAIVGTATGGGSGAVTQDENGYIVLDDEGGSSVTVEALNVTQNGTYTAPTGKAYSPVTVTVSGGGGADKSDVNFIDYDGTVLHSYTVAEFKELTAMPANPSHSGLVAQGWNWSLADAKAQLTAMPDSVLTIGQMYETESGKTEIDLVFEDDDFLSPYLAVCPNGTITVDWGDGSATETMTGTSYTIIKYLQHTYARTGSYTMTIDGNVGFYVNSNGYSAILRDTATTNSRMIYAKCIRAVRIGVSARVGNNAFNYCYALTSVSIPDVVTSMGTYAFNGCYALKSLTIPDGVTSISNNAFNNCYALTSVSIPADVTSIGNYAFSVCYSLASVFIPDSVTSIGSNVFMDCHTLTSVSIPDVTSISSNIFSGCYALKSLTIPDGVTSIGSSAFNGCYALKSVSIPDDVTSIGDRAFSNCYALSSLTIPDGVTSIGTYAFNGCHALKSLTIPDDVTSIGTYVFSGCYSLTSVSIPDSVTSIGSYAFNGCYALSSLTIPDDVASIGDRAFSNCYALTSLTIPDGVTSIGTYAFNSCYSVLEYHFLSTTPPTLGTTAFSGIITGTKIYVPTESLEAYKTAANWSTYASYMVGE